ncbi:MAG: O-fucosyltransferase family protein [Rhodospirillaceae bacterium]|nr:O-fucosyltransferase family protein [Rhodospirillaceae bacterium]MDD9928295.1 O-fucosyltransferase family protein [Rhodospirillaceae bacterium]
MEAIRLLYEKYFVLQSDIQTEIDAFRAENFDANPVFAVHVRSLDKGREDPEFLRDNADMLPVLDAALAEDPKLRLFLMTDSETVLEQYAGRYGDRVFNTDCARTEGIIPLTWQDTDARHRLGVEVIKDTYLAASCDRFIGYGGSSVACMVACLKRWPEGACTLLGDNIKIRRNWLLHDW